MFSAQRSYSKEEKKPTDPEKLSQEIDELKEQIQKLKQRQSPPVVDSESSDKSSDEVQIDITDRQIGDSDEELNLYRLAYDFPGFKSKNIRVTISDNLLKIYAFQTAGKKSDAHKDKPTEYIYEHTNEEILPDQVSVDMVSASFDAENGFLVIEAILPDDVPAEQVLADTRKRNELLSKTQEQIEKKQKLLQSLLARETEPPPSTASSTKD